MSRLAADQWSTYWKQGSITTFQDAFAGNYDREIGKFWSAVFAGIDERAHIVDLACGNGALALLAAAHSRDEGKQFRIDAIDFADIQTPADASSQQLLGAINFLPGRRLESTGLESACYDAAISQFGIEYGELEASVAEVDRILKPGKALLVMMVHHVDSAILSQGRDALDSVRICKDYAAPGLVQRLQTRLEQVRSEGQDPATDQACEQMRESLNQAIAELNAAADASKDERHLDFFIRSCMSPFAKSAMRGQTLQQRLQVVERAVAETEAFEARMLDLESAALCEDKLASWTRALEVHGFELESSMPVEMDDKLFAHALAFRR